MKWLLWCGVVVVVAVMAAGAETEADSQPTTDTKGEGEKGITFPTTNETTKYKNKTTNILRIIRGEALLPDENECGKRSRKSYRVYFGEDAPLSAYPWMALLGYNKEEKPDWLCGGSLINYRYVLTAGHCVHRESIKGNKLIKVRLGEHNLNTNPDCPEDFIDSSECADKYKEFGVEMEVTHAYYEPKTLYYDIALIRLTENVTMSHSIQPVCLPKIDLDVKEFLGSRDAVVVGWGTTEKGGKPKILQRAPIPYNNNSVCGDDFNSRITDNQLCFGGRGRQDSCFGDSGGPLMQSKSGTGQYYQLGIVSFGMHNCGMPGVPAVYTNVARYRNWIAAALRP